jgi:hypothetical protein
MGKNITVAFCAGLQDYPEDRDLLARKAAKAKKEAAAKQAASKPRTWADDEVGGWDSSFLPYFAQGA